MAATNLTRPDCLSCNHFGVFVYQVGLDRQQKIVRSITCIHPWQTQTPKREYRNVNKQGKMSQKTFRQYHLYLLIGPKSVLHIIT